jgi:hypothetical protein
MKLWEYVCLTALWFALVPGVRAEKRALMESLYAERDPLLNTDPGAEFWQASRPVYVQLDARGRALPQFRTAVRSRWTRNHIYFLFVSPYQQLYVNPTPDTVHETYQLWDWDVVEVFIGSDFHNIRHYKEFEVSPQNEWIDLNIDLNQPHHEQGWLWNSGFEHTTRIDADKHLWYAALRIPFTALAVPAPNPSTSFRLNLFRTEGPPQQQKQIMWQPTMSTTFHVPERFGLLRLVGGLHRP